MNFDLNQFKGIILDIDGVIYRGNTIIDGVIDFITALQKNSIPFLFLTNNSSKTQLQVKDKLLSLGLKNITENQILSSAVASGIWLKNNVRLGEKILVFGMDGLKSEVLKLGLSLTEKSDAQYVLAGLKSDLTYEDLTIASLALRNGAKLIASNTDRTFPTERGLQPGAGSLIKALSHASDVEPHVVMGKPAKELFLLACQLLGSPPLETLMIGDRLDTDILGAQNAGIRSLLVFTGVSTPKCLESSLIKPDWSANNLRELI